MTQVEQVHKTGALMSEEGKRDGALSTNGKGDRALVCASEAE